MSRTIHAATTGRDEGGAKARGPLEPPQALSASGRARLLEVVQQTVTAHRARSLTVNVTLSDPAQAARNLLAVPVSGQVEAGTLSRALGELREAVKR